LVQSTLNDLNVLDARIAALSLFSPNELLEDISTTDLIYLFVPYVCAEVQGRVRATERDERMLLIDQSQVRSPICLRATIPDPTVLEASQYIFVKTRKPGNRPRNGAVIT
jgi:TAP42-like family